MDQSLGPMDESHLLPAWFVNSSLFLCQTGGTPRLGPEILECSASMSRGLFDVKTGADGERQRLAWGCRWCASEGKHIPLPPSISSALRL